jgi:hypothetical protein
MSFLMQFIEALEINTGKKSLVEVKEMPQK